MPAAKRPRGSHFSRNAPAPGLSRLRLSRSAPPENTPGAIAAATEAIPVVRNPRNVSVARSGAVMAVGTTVSRLLGFLKGVLIAYTLGTLGPLSSIFDSANNLPNLLYIMLAGGVFNVVLVPQIIKASRLPDKGADYLSRLLTLGIVVLAVITTTLTLLAAPVMGLLTEFSDEQLTLAIQFAVWLLPQIFFYGVYALLGQLLNAHDRFGAYMWAPVINNIVAIAGIGVFLWIWGTNEASSHTVQNWSGSQTIVLAGTTTLGVVLQALILLIPVRALGLGLRPRWGWRGMGLGATAKIAAWALATMVTGQLTYIVITWIGTTATLNPEDSTNPGTFVFFRASDIYILPHSIIVLSLATIFFNQMARTATSGDRVALRESTSRLIRTVGVATVFFATVLFVLSGQLGMLLSGGQAQAGLSMGIAIAILALSSPFLSLNFMFTRVFYALENARTPFILQSILVVLSILMAAVTLLFPKSLLIYALLGTVSLGNFLSPILSGLVLRAHIGDIGLARVLRSPIRFLVAAVVAAIVGVLVLLPLGGISFIGQGLNGFAWQSPLTAFIAILIVGVVMTVVYLLSLRAMRVEELTEFLEPLLTRFTRRVPAFLKKDPGTDPLVSKGQKNAAGPEPEQVAARLEEMNVANSIEVGSILGGRYKVTEYVLASAEGDLVLDGVDRVLNRPVSIVVAAADNAENLAQSSREVAMGDRAAGFQILDLGLGGDNAYLIATKAAPADLLDLLVPTAPYVEPAFTDTLGIELFGTPRPPASHHDGYVYEDNSPVTELPHQRSTPPSSESSRSPAPPLPSAPPSSTQNTRSSPELSSDRDTSPTPPTASDSESNRISTSQPAKVTLWEDDAEPHSRAEVIGATVSVPEVSSRIDKPVAEQAESTAPDDRPNASAPNVIASASMPAPAAAEPEFDEDETNKPRSGRWLMMAVLVVILGVAVVIAATQLGNLFNSAPPAATSTSPNSSSDSSSDPTTSAPVTPTPTAVTRFINGGDPGLSSETDGDLNALIDGNPATVWSSLQFASAQFGRLATSMALVIELQEPANVGSVTINQAGGTGGSFEVFASNQPTLTNARSIGTGSFTGAEITVATTQNEPTRYLIISFTELPRLQTTSIPNLPFGLRISGISIA